MSLFHSQLVRLTWWTRNDMSKREPMEPEEEEENKDKSSELQGIKT